MGLLIVAAGISPTGDPFNFALVAIPLVVLYEASILVVGVAERKPREETGAASDGAT